MTSLHPPTTIRFTEEDRAVLARLSRLTGLASSAAVIRLAIRESLTTREAARRPARKGAK
jgi:hypothetical protein